MSIRVSEDVGAAELNSAQLIGRVESKGPAVITVKNQSDTSNVVVSFQRETAGTLVNSDKETDVASEASGYTGDGSTLTFTGQALNNVPIIPGSVTLTPATSGPVLTDDYGDGILYTAAGVEAGSINYFTGALELSYPTGSAPDGAISAAYTYQDAVLVHGGQRNFEISSFDPDDALEVYAAADNAAGALVKVDAAATWG